LPPGAGGEFLLSSAILRFLSLNQNPKQEKQIRSQRLSELKVHSVLYEAR
jgi:hypothetical protein